MMVDIKCDLMKATDFPWETVNAVGPHLLWLIFVVGFLYWIGRDRLASILSRVQKLNVAGVEIEFREMLEQAAEARQQILPVTELGRASRRLERSSYLTHGARILWIDDQPDNNRFEESLLERAGARVDAQVSSDGARCAIERISYDVILSDIDRSGNAQAGLEFAHEIAVTGRAAPLIFYVTNVRGPTPDGAFGITQRPDELLHLILDVLARNRS